MTTEEEKNHKKQAFKVLTTDITVEQRKQEILELLDESLKILSNEIEKLKRKIKLNSLSSVELDAVYAELKANAPIQEE
jgi:hypothetical protein